MKKSLPAQARPLALLAEINHTLAVARNARTGLQRALEILAQRCRVLQAWVVLIDPDSGQLKIEASEGLTAEGQRATWGLGEGVTGRVVQTERPIIVPHIQISQKPMLLHRTGRRRSGRSGTTFICVPIPDARKAIGAFNVDLAFEKNRDYERDLQFFRVVATMFAQAIRVRQLVEAERQRLLDENIQLKKSQEALRLLAHRGHEPPDATGIRTDRARRSLQHDGVGPRRVRYGQGVDRPRDSLQFRAREEAVRQGELRCAAGLTDRVRAIWV